MSETRSRSSSLFTGVRVAPTPTAHGRIVWPVTRQSPLMLARRSWVSRVVICCLYVRSIHLHCTLRGGPRRHSRERPVLSKSYLWLFFLVALSSTPVRAHDIYRHLVDGNGASCCSDKDCMPAPFRVGPDGVRMFVQGRWIAVPSNKIQYRTLIGDRGETGGGHWCGWALDPTGPTGDTRAHTICAILPPNLAAVAHE